jgi:hypothetical protein
VDWQWSTAQSNTPTHSWFSASQTSVADRVLVTPPIGIISTTTMSFYHTYSFEGTSTCYDGGTLEYSTNGTTWTVIPDSYFTSGGFNGTVSSSYGNPIGGKRAWCGGTIGNMTQVNLNLGALAGNTIYLRFHAGEDSSYANTGWYVDTIRINNAGTQTSCQTSSGCTPPSPPNLNSATATCNGINLSYAAGAGETQSFNIYKINGVCGGTPFKIAGPITDTNYLDLSALDGSTYSYMVKGSCSSTGSPESNYSNCISVNSYTLLTPTISGNSENTCPEEYVTLSTQSGMSNYQWFKDGNLINGANSNTFSATESGNYTVSYTNSYGCSATSSPFSVSINQCLPNIVYISSSNLEAFDEDGDLVPEAGEKWKFNVTLKNIGQKDAINVLASLSGERIIPCNSPLNFGDISINSESTKTFEFIIDPNQWYFTYSCGSSIGFDLISKTSNNGLYNYSNDLNFKTSQIGNPPTNENQIGTALNITNLKNTNKTSAFSPSFTLTPNISFGTVSFDLSGSTDLVNCVKVELLAPDNSSFILKDFGQSHSSPYNIKDFYNLKGIGTYTLKGYEILNCGSANQYVDITNISMNIQKQVGGNCSTYNSNCSLSEVSNLKIYKNGTNVDIQFNDLGNFRYNLYVSKTPQTNPFQVTGSSYGKKDCNVLASTIGGNLKEISNYNLDLNIAGDYSILYVLITSDNGFGTEGTLGFDSFLNGRTATEYYAK